MTGESPPLGVPSIPVRVGPEALKMRAGPSLDEAQLATLFPGVSVVLASQEEPGDWLPVWLFGYVFREYTDLGPDGA